MITQTKMALAALGMLLGACASTPEVVAPISAADFAAYRLNAVSVDASEAQVQWPQVQRDYALQQGVRIPPSASGGPDDSDGFDEGNAALQAKYNETISSPEAIALMQERARAEVEPKITQAIAPAFTGQKPVSVDVTLEGFTVQSSAAVALGGREGAIASVRIYDPADDRTLATLPSVQFASAALRPGYASSAGGLLGLAISVAVVAAVNVATDAVRDSGENVAEGLALNLRKQLLLPEEFTFPES